MRVGALLSDMKKLCCISLVFVLLFSFSFCVFADNEADINKDSFVDIRDVIAMKKLILNAKHYVAQGNFDIMENSDDQDYNAIDLANLVSYLIGATDSFSHFETLDLF